MTVWKSDYGGYGHKNSVGTLCDRTATVESDERCVCGLLPPSQEEEVVFVLPNTNNVLRSRWHRRRCFCVHSTINQKVAKTTSGQKCTSQVKM